MLSTASSVIFWSVWSLNLLRRRSSCLCEYLFMHNLVWLWITLVILLWVQGLVCSNKALMYHKTTYSAITLLGSRSLPSALIDRFHREGQFYFIIFHLIVDGNQKVMIKYCIWIIRTLNQCLHFTFSVCSDVGNSIKWHCYCCICVQANWMYLTANDFYPHLFPYINNFSRVIYPTGWHLTLMNQTWWCKHKLT